MPEHLHHLTNAALSPAANTTFSAVILLSQYQFSDLDLEAWRRLYARQQAGEIVNPFDQLTILEELAPTFAVTPRYEGTIRVIVIENRHARLPFPDDVFRGPFDQRWGWNEEWCGPTWIGSTLQSLADEGAPFHIL